MAWGSQPVLEVRTTGNDTNGGGVNAATVGTDYSQQDAAQISITDAVGNGTTIVTSASGLFTSNMVGNFSYMAGGSGSLAAQWVEVVTFTNTNTIVVDRVIAAGTGITLNLGGALASPAVASAAITSGTGIGAVVFVKSSTYLMSTTANVANGLILLGAGGTGSRHMRWIGYNTNRAIGNTDTKPIFRPSANSVTLMNQNGQSLVSVENITFDGSTFTGVRAISNSGSSVRPRIVRCNFIGNLAAGAIAGGATQFVFGDCKFACDGGTAIQSGGVYIRCEFTLLSTASASNIVFNGVMTFVDCIFYGNGGSSTTYITINGASNIDIMNCVFVGGGNVVRAIQYTGASTLLVHIRIVNSIFMGFTSYAITSTNTSDGIYVENCAFYNNSSGPVNTLTISSGGITGSIPLSGDPFVNAVGGDFRLNNATGAGALCRATGLPGAFPSGTTTGYKDIGAVQHATPPLGLTITQSGADALLTWDVDPRATSFNIKRGTTAINTTTLASGITGNTYLDVGAWATPYFYSIEGVP